MKSFYEQLRTEAGSALALLVDPDTYDERFTERSDRIYVNMNPPDLLLVGGSILFKPIEITITALKLGTSLPVFIFPGNAFPAERPGRRDFLFVPDLRPQSGISHREPCAGCPPPEARSGIEVIPTAYMLIENGTLHLVEYMSNTRPIPAHKPEIAVATAMAGEMLGLKPSTWRQAVEQNILWRPP
jgi:heptaprenylglyceryl phosphate synthase